MNIFLIGENHELTKQLEAELTGIPKSTTFRFDRSNPEILKCETGPSIVITVSDYNETWGWWLVTELYFQFPGAVNILVQVRADGNYHKKISEKLFLVVADEKIIGSEVMSLLKLLYPASVTRTSST